VRARTVADTERVITAFVLSAILGLTFSLDLDEVGRIRTTARPI
jgi:hypothetical protein